MFLFRIMKHCFVWRWWVNHFLPVWVHPVAAFCFSFDSRWIGRSWMFPPVCQDKERRSSKVCGAMHSGGAESDFCRRLQAFPARVSPPSAAQTGISKLVSLTWDQSMNTEMIIALLTFDTSEVFVVHITILYLHFWDKKLRIGAFNSSCDYLKCTRGTRIKV